LSNCLLPLSAIAIKKDFRWFPIKSSTVTNSLSGNFRNPRPSCWTKIIEESVGRSISIKLTDGISIPSLKISTENITSKGSRFDSSLEIAAVRWGMELSPERNNDGIPFLLNSSVMNSACSSVAQNPRALRFDPSWP